jgi:hypothetical protein
MIDRSEVNRALAKAIAFKQCGKHAQAEAWAAELVRLLECAAILDPNTTARVQAAARVQAGFDVIEQRRLWRKWRGAKKRAAATDTADE